MRGLKIRSIALAASWIRPAGAKMAPDPSVASSAVDYESRRRRPRQNTTYDFRSDAVEYSQPSYSSLNSESPFWSSISPRKSWQILGIERGHGAKSFERMNTPVQFTVSGGVRMIASVKP